MAVISVSVSVFLRSSLFPSPLYICFCLPYFRFYVHFHELLVPHPLSSIHLTALRVACFPVFVASASGSLALEKDNVAQCAPHLCSCSRFLATIAALWSSLLHQLQSCFQILHVFKDHWEWGLFFHGQQWQPVSSCRLLGPCRRGQSETLLHIFRLEGKTPSPLLSGQLDGFVHICRFVLPYTEG